MNLLGDKLAKWAPHDVAVQLSDINESFVRLLVDSAKLPEEPTSDFVMELRDLLRRAEDSAKAMATHAPVLLVDIEFQNQHWWGTVAKDPSRALAARLFDFPAAEAIELARDTLMLAWCLARADLASSLALVGMSRPVARTVGSLRPKQIDQIAEHQYASLRPRWEDRPWVWRELLTGAHWDPNRVRTFVIRTLRLCGAKSRPAGWSASARRVIR